MSIVRVARESTYGGHLNPSSPTPPDGDHLEIPSTGNTATAAPASSDPALDVQGVQVRTARKASAASVTKPNRKGKQEVDHLDKVLVLIGQLGLFPLGDSGLGQFSTHPQTEGGSAKSAN